METLHDLPEDYTPVETHHSHSLLPPNPPPAHRPILGGSRNRLRFSSDLRLFALFPPLTNPFSWLHLILQSQLKSLEAFHDYST